MKQNYEILTNAKRPDGSPYSVIKIPVPDLQYKERIVDDYLQQLATEHGVSLALGDTIHHIANTSYLAYVLANESMAVPKYWIEGLSFSVQLKDGEVEGFFQRLFPKVMIKPVHPLGLNYEGKSAYDVVLSVPGEKEDS
ncbi:MAG: agmatine deiminase family protein, partial [Phaeodactylibacter sp.]|nr:agmatine deiminase family protein [Phaeodactylibacter sp.]